MKLSDALLLFVVVFTAALAANLIALKVASLAVEQKTADSNLFRVLGALNG